MSAAEPDDSPTVRRARPLCVASPQPAFPLYSSSPPQQGRSGLAVLRDRSPSRDRSTAWTEQSEIPYMALGICGHDYLSAYSSEPTGLCSTVRVTKRNLTLFPRCSRGVYLPYVIHFCWSRVVAFCCRSHTCLLRQRQLSVLDRPLRACSARSCQHCWLSSQRRAYFRRTDPLRSGNSVRCFRRSGHARRPSDVLWSTP